MNMAGLRFLIWEPGAILEWILVALLAEFGVSVYVAPVVGHAGAVRKSRSGTSTQVALSS